MGGGLREERSVVHSFDCTSRKGPEGNLGIRQEPIGAPEGSETRCKGEEEIRSRLRVN